MIATIDLFDKSNIEYTTTLLWDKHLLALWAHQDQEYETLKTVKHGWPERKIDFAQNL